MQLMELKAGYGVCYQETHDQAEDGSSKHLAERVSQHGFQVFRSELALPMDVAEDAAPFVDDLRLLACLPPDTHGIVDDNRSKRGSYGEVYSTYSLGESDAGHQCNHSCRMAGGHAAGADKQMPREPTLKEGIDKRLEQLRKKK